MLDTLAEAWAQENDGASIWTNPDVTFLDPFTKSGVFLREITARLTKGLAEEIPDLAKRVDHILTKQVFGIAITKLTSLLARRSVYCSKWADGEHSIAKSFDNPNGNVWFERLEHSWEGGTEWVVTADKDGNRVKKFTNGRCKYCGAPQLLFDREDGLETHAYAFIHTDDIEARLAELFGGDMQFDVVVGNPPYQMTGGAGGSSDSSIYHLFVQQAMKLEPRFLSMVIPSRWLAGGRGLDEFRKQMLTSHKLRVLVDNPNSKNVFPGVEIKGGLCYFLWDSSYDGLCEVTIDRDADSNTALRKLDEFDVFVRDPMAASILRKVLDKTATPVSQILTADTPFGIATNFDGHKPVGGPNDVPLYYIQRMKRGVGFIHRDSVKKNTPLIDKWKVFVPEAYNGGDAVPHPIVGKSVVAPAGAVCTQSYLAFYLDTEDEAKSLQSYYETKFFRFLVSLRKITQHALRSTYGWVPMQSWDRSWTDEQLYAKYELQVEEVDFIESVIKPMDSGD
jgi:site-specific DNA-methyltransferase (adenine-specific)